MDKKRNMDVMEIVVQNEKLKKWIEEVRQMCTPESVYWCDGSKREYNTLMTRMVENGAAVRLRKRKTVFCSAPILLMWPGWKAAPLSVLPNK